MATSVYKSAISPYDEFSDGIAVGDVLTVAYSVDRGGLSRTNTLLLRHGGPDEGTSVLTGPASIAPSTSALVLVRVKDQWGNPIGGLSITFSASFGSITSPSTTSELGYASALYTAGAATETTPAVISASITGGLILTHEISVVVAARFRRPGQSAEYEDEAIRIFREAGILLPQDDGRELPEQLK